MLFRLHSSSLPYLLVSSILLLLFYIPLAGSTFAFHNDWIILINGVVPDAHLETQHLINIGRPLGAWLLNLSNQFLYATGTNFLRDIMLARFFNLTFLLTLHAYFLLRLHALTTLAPSRLTLLGFLIFILPAYRLNVLWQGNLVPGILACLGGAAAFECCVRWQWETSRPRRLGWIFLAMLLLLAVHLIYTPAASILLFFICTIILGTRGHRTQVRHAWKVLALFLGSAGLYFIYLKCFVAGDAAGMQRGYTISLAESLASILISLIALFKYCASLWLTTKTPFFWILFLICLGVAGWRHRSLLWQQREAAALILIILGVTSAPNVISQTQWNVHYRSTGALQSELAVVLLCSLGFFHPGSWASRWSKFLACWILVPSLACFSFIAANQIIRNQQEQFAFFKYTLLAQPRPTPEITLCINARFLRYTPIEAETMVNDALLPLDLSYPALYTSYVLENMRLSVLAQSGMDKRSVRFDCGQPQQEFFLDAAGHCVNCLLQPPVPVRRQVRDWH